MQYSKYYSDIYESLFAFVNYNSTYMHYVPSHKNVFLKQTVGNAFLAQNGIIIKASVRSLRASGPVAIGKVLSGNKFENRLDKNTF